jgi:hypothetical protein
MEYRGSHREQAPVPGMRKAFVIAAHGEAGEEGVPAFQTGVAAKNAVDHRERGACHDRCATKRAATAWRDETHWTWDVQQSADGWCEVIPTAWHRQ